MFCLMSSLVQAAMLGLNPWARPTTYVLNNFDLSPTADITEDNLEGFIVFFLYVLHTRLFPAFLCLRQPEKRSL
jgi:hypothetical protein